MAARTSCQVSPLFVTEKGLQFGALLSATVFNSLLQQGNIMPFVRFLSESGDLGELMAREPERYQPFVDFAQQVLTGRSELSKGDREMLGACVSALNQCAYCTGTHAAIAKAHGIDASLVNALVDDFDNASIDQKMRPLLHYARKVTEEPFRLTQADADAILAVGWSEQTVSDVVAIAALFAMANRLVDGHGIQALPPAMNDLVGERVAGQGYAIPKDGH